MGVKRKLLWWAFVDERLLEALSAELGRDHAELACYCPRDRRGEVTLRLTADLEIVVADDVLRLTPTGDLVAEIREHLAAIECRP